MTDDMSLTPNEPAKHSKWRSPKRIIAVVAIALVAVVALGYGAIFFYANVLNDSPDALGASDLEAVFATTTAVGDAGTLRHGGPRGTRRPRGHDGRTRRSCRHDGCAGRSRGRSGRRLRR